MATLNQMELQNIRHLCGAGAAICKKIEYFKTVTTDTNATEILTNICGACGNLKQELTQML